MGDFRIIVDAVGGHGQDREKVNGEIVDFGTNTPEAIAKDFVTKLKDSGVNVQSAKVVHWPMDNYGGPEQNGRLKEVVDDLITGVRTNSFKDKLQK